ncbi:hypothetical protein [Lysobacter sp. TAB13]
MFDQRGTLREIGHMLLEGMDLDEFARQRPAVEIAPEFFHGRGRTLL